jgi:hypothetical protein
MADCNKTDDFELVFVMNLYQRRKIKNLATFLRIVKQSPYRNQSKPKRNRLQLNLAKRNWLSLSRLSRILSTNRHTIEDPTMLLTQTLNVIKVILSGIQQRIINGLTHFLNA